jgi:uncharacterized membrane protein YdbT with pleckstrin-like domain
VTEEERDVWYGTPSQIVNLGTFIIMGLLFWLVIPLFVILWRWLVIKCTKYELTTQRLRTRHGVINKQTDEIELYRVRDYRYEQPLLLRMFSLGNIVMQTSDKTHPVFTLRAVHNGEELRNVIRTHVEQNRTRKGVREVDIE